MQDAEVRTVVVTGGAGGTAGTVRPAFAGPKTGIYFNYSSSTEAAREPEPRVSGAGGTARGLCRDVAGDGMYI